MARKDSAVLEEKVLPPLHRPCDYCKRGSVGAVNGFSYCRDHAWDAMDGKKPMIAEPAGRKFMPYSTPKPVAGE